MSLPLLATNRHQSLPYPQATHQTSRQITGNFGLDAATQLAVDLYVLGNHDAASGLHRDTLTSYRETRGDDHPSTLWAAALLDDARQASGLTSLSDWLPQPNDGLINESAHVSVKGPPVSQLIDRPR